MGSVKVLLDTSILIDHLRQKNKIKTKLVLLAGNYDELCVSAVSITELYSGKSMEDSKNLKMVEDLISGLEVIYPNEDVFKTAGRLRRAYSLSLADSIIASTCETYKIKLATLDVRDFIKTGLELA